MYDNSDKLGLQKFIILTLMYQTYIMLGGLLFLYLEECLAEEKEVTVGFRHELKSFTAYLHNEANLTVVEQSWILNRTERFFVFLSSLRYAQKFLC